MEDRKDKEGEKPFSFSCGPAMEATWFCYSPVYQLRVYYREGTFTTCSEKWAELFDCFKLKTKSLEEAQAIIEARKQSGPQYWEVRSKEEAAKFWKEQYGEMLGED